MRDSRCERLHQDVDGVFPRGRACDAASLQRGILFRSGEAFSGNGGRQKGTRGIC